MTLLMERLPSRSAFNGRSARNERFSVSKVRRIIPTLLIQDRYDIIALVKKRMEMSCSFVGSGLAW